MVLMKLGAFALMLAIAVGAGALIALVANWANRRG